MVNGNPSWKGFQVGGRILCQVARHFAPKLTFHSVHMATRNCPDLHWLPVCTITNFTSRCHSQLSRDVVDLCGKNNWSYCTTKIITMSSRLLPGLFGPSNFLRCASNRTMMKADTLVLTIQIIVCCACKRTPPISRKLNAATNHPQHLMFSGKICVHKIT